METSTLMTFLVRTPPMTRSVVLYGSWDNFSLPYPMKRDTRLGPEHWSGCHSFENIICDGNVDTIGRSRKGGLRMGGTYWYYYQLDNGIDFHNSAESSTTSCPLLPGQLVNILHVPFVLSGSRKRDASVSSTTSEFRTLNPSDKYMNPRPVPTPPPMMRTSTSPTALHYSSSSFNSPIGGSQPSLSRSSSRENLLAANKHRLPRKASLDNFVHTGSVSNKSAGLRQAFRIFKAGRTQSPNSRFRHIVEWIPQHESPSNDNTPKRPAAADTALYPEASCATPEQVRPSRGLLLRSTSENSIPTSSFLAHRRERSRSRSCSRPREPSSMRNSVVMDESSHSDLDPALTQHLTLDTVVEVASPLTASICHANITEIQSQSGTDSTNQSIQLEKRLPTLPNTPSSAYPPSVVGDSPVRKMSEQLQNMDSHFSATTIDTDCHRYSVVGQNVSRFSEWSTTSDLTSPTSDITVDDILPSPVNVESCGFGPSMRLVEASTPEFDSVSVLHNRSDLHITSSTSCTTISSATSTVPSSSHGEDSIPSFTEGGVLPSSTTRRGVFLHYSLPDEQNSSAVTLKRCQPTEEQCYDHSSKLNHVHIDHQGQSARHRRNGFPHSESMQQLIDELSYLSDVIIQN